MIFAGKIGLVAVGAGALGRAVSLGVLDADAGTIVAYQYDNESTDLRTAASANVSRLVGHKTDVTNEAAVGELIEQILSEKGRLDGLVNTLGGYTGGMKMRESEASILDRMPALRQGKDATVNVAAKAAIEHAAGVAAYAASKAAALALMDCLAANLKGSGVRVNSILPTLIDTEPDRKAMLNVEAES
jgi:NAD(P)-dependent dehydrogenase (short-subunit alcohol dehydrogenase family)